MRTMELRLAPKAGFSLIEVMLAMSVLAVVLTMLYGAALMMAKTARTEDSVVMLNSEARSAMQSIVRSLRQAPEDSLATLAGGAFVPLGNAAVTNIQFRRVADIDGNGNALDVNLDLESEGPFQFTLDTADGNADGLTTTQLVRTDAVGNVIEVLANHISTPIVTPDLYSAPQGGLLFQDLGNDSIQVTLILRHRADVTLPMMVVRLDEVVTPRN